jgi:hypothetical protein
MISFANESVHGDCGLREFSAEPRAVGQFMAAVLARYGISPNADSVRPRLPQLYHQPTQIGELLSVG